MLVTGASKRDAAMLTGKGGRNISINFHGAESDIGQIVPITITSAGKTTLRGKKEGE